MDCGMTAPVHRIIEGLKQIERRVSPQQLMRAKAVVREQEARFLLEMVTDAIAMLEDAYKAGTIS